MRDGSTPYDPKDPLWPFKEAAAVARECERKVVGPWLAALAKRVDQMWDEAIAEAKAKAKQDE